MCPTFARAAFTGGSGVPVANDPGVAMAQERRAVGTGRQLPVGRAMPAEIRQVMGRRSQAAGQPLLKWSAARRPTDQPPGCRKITMIVLLKFESIHQMRPLCSSYANAIHTWEEFAHLSP